jgi:hypothetical protein
MGDEEVVIDSGFIHRVEAEKSIWLHGLMHAGDTGSQPVDVAGVVDRVKKAGNQIEGFIKPDITHVAQDKMGLRAAGFRFIQHRLIDVQAQALIADVQEMPDMRAGATGQVKVPIPVVSEKLVEAAHRIALTMVVNVLTHQVVVA